MELIRGFTEQAFITQAGIVPSVATVVALLSFWRYLRRDPAPDRSTGEARRQIQHRAPFNAHENIPDGVVHSQSAFLNSRGGCICTQSWAPANEVRLRALIFMCHGYADSSSGPLFLTAVRLAQQGYAVYALDYEGHGRSDGLHVSIQNFDNIIDDCHEHFSRVAALYPRSGSGAIKRFLFGESMGGAVALRLAEKHPELAVGLVLLAPMCKIADELKPHPFSISILRKVARVFPEAAITPVPDLAKLCFRREEVYLEVITLPYHYDGRPRLGTAVVLQDTCDSIESRLHTYTFPFLVLHGAADQVTCPDVSKALYQKAASKDKTMKLYPGSFHSLLVGEEPDTSEIVYSDIFAWLQARC